MAPLISRIIILTALSSSIVLLGQDQDPQQAAELVEMGKEMRKAALALDDIREIMVQAANLDTTNLEANLEAGTLHLRTINKEDALPYFLRIYRANPDYRTDLEYWIALSYHHGLRFRQAMEFYIRFRKKIAEGRAPRTKIQVSVLDRHIEECRNGILMVAKPKNFLIRNLGSAVNSEAADYSPSLTLTGDLLVFTSRRRDGNLNENVSLRDNKPFEDIFISRKKDGNWQPAVNIGPPVNTPGNDSDLSFNPKGDILYTFLDGDIYAAQILSNGSWSTPVALTAPINSDSTEKGFTITSSGLAIFGSRRAGGYGGVDLYACQRNSNGTWGQVRNLGPAINTEFNEESPSIDANGKILYFSSNGKRGMGGYDVYRAVLLDEAKLSWSEPENLGYPINTPDDDLYFIGTGDKGRGYFASVREGGLGYLDIYEVTIPDFKSVQAALLPIQLQITVRDASDRKILNANLELLYAADQTHASTPVEGKNGPVFYIRTPTAKTYILTAEADGYKKQQIRIDLPATTTSEQIVRREIYLTKEIPAIPEKTKPSEIIAETKPVVPALGPSGVTDPVSFDNLSFLFFATASSQLTAAAQQQITELAQMLRTNPNLRINLVGHTDNIGNETLNLQLARQRTAQAAQILIQAGIAADRIETLWSGERKPVVTNDDEIEGRQLNRRVEIRIR